MKHADKSSEHQFCRGSSLVARVTNTMGRFVDQAKESKGLYGGEQKS